MVRTPAFQLVDLKLGGTLQEFVAERRANSVPWHRVASDIFDATGVELSGEAVRRWFQKETA